MEFDTPEDLIEACEKAYAEGYRKMDAFAPMPVDGLAEAIGYKRNKVALCVLIGGYRCLRWLRVSGMDLRHRLPA